MWSWGDPLALRTPSDVAVVIPSILRETLERAVKSVFSQAFNGRIHLIVGIDQPETGRDMLSKIFENVPANVVAQVFYPGYSTSERHGGLYKAWDGGAVRTILSYMANAPLIAYLDDDNWFAPNHLATLAKTIEPVDWAFSRRCFVHHQSHVPVCVDGWESTGPGMGVYNQRFGGFVDPNTLMVKRLTCEPMFGLWTRPLRGNRALGADRSVFAYLAKFRRWAGTGLPTAFYVMNPADPLHPKRLTIMARAGIGYDALGIEGRPEGGPPVPGGAGRQGND
jgi:hypothetical protein